MNPDVVLGRGAVKLNTLIVNARLDGMDRVKRSLTAERVYTIDTGEPLYYEGLGVTELGEK